MPETRPRFSGRAFISLNMTISFLILIVSSVILYIIPPGRDAYWTNWTLWGLNKDQWGALHTVGGLGFVVFGIIHLIPYNWKVFWNYIISRIRKNLNKKAELAAAIVLNVLIVLVCVFNWFPSSVIMDWGHSLKNSWVSTAQRAPYGHAEGETLRVLADRLDFDLTAALGILGEKSLDVDPDQTILSNAARNNMTPAEFFEILSPLLPAGAAAARGGEAETEMAPRGGGGGGWGRKTVQSYCDEIGIDPASAVAKLGAKGIEAKTASNLRDLATKAGLTPVQVAEIIKN
jgi:hypothetical protein